MRLVLDPSQAYNGRLLAPYNAESTLASVLRKLQGIPVLCVQDLETAFWRLRLDQKKHLCFLMDLEQTGLLTAQVTPTSRLVAVMVLCVVMGVSQSGLYLALARGDVDIEDKVLLRLLKELVYVDDLHHGVLPGEVQAIQNRTFPNLPLADMERECEDKLCCPGPAGNTAAVQAGPATGRPRAREPMTAPPPAELVTATRHLLHTEFGKQISHCVILRCAKVSLAFARANFPTKAPVTSLAGSICPIFIQEAVKYYTEQLHLGSQPTFEQLKNLPIPDGYERSQFPQWYRPWRRTSPDLSLIHI